MKELSYVGRQGVGAAGKAERGIEERSREWKKEKDRGARAGSEWNVKVCGKSRVNGGGVV